MPPKTHIKKLQDTRFPRVDVRLYRAKVMELVGFDELDMGLLQLESGCAFLEHLLQQRPNVPNAYTRSFELLKFEPELRFWACWNFIFVGKCTRLVLSWHSYEDHIGTFGQANPRQAVIDAFMQLHLDEIAQAQFDDHLKYLTAPQLR